MGLFSNTEQKISKRPKPVVLISMDGVGVAPPGPGNAVTLADTSNLDKYWPKYAHGVIQASGLYVGLPAGTDGNSEVGHMTMGAGKVILQDKPRIDNAIQKDTFESNPILLDSFNQAKKAKSGLHFMGLIGSGHVHSSFEHLQALIKMAANLEMNPDKVYIHVFLDGRDSNPDAGIELLERLETYCLQKKMGRIVSIVGRAYAMDRNRNWLRTKKAYELITLAKGEVVMDWKKALEESYKKKIFDEYIEPLVVVNKVDKVPVKVQNNDSIIFFNFRQDRALQLSMAFEDENFKHFQRPQLTGISFTGMTDYGKGHPKNIAFPVEDITNPLGKVLSIHGIKQLRIAESEKFAHVTYFFNGGNGNVSENEVWLEIPSPKDVPSYDLKPEMSQEWMTTELIKKIDSKEFDFILTNFAGPDMVGHTGVIDATVKSMEVCDKCIGQVVEKVLSLDGVVVISADHGNAEEMINLQTGDPDTKHSTNEVPLLIIGNNIPPIELPMGGLADIAPTILGILGIEQPADMTGRNLLN